MRYLRMLSNSVVAGVLASCYVLVLILQLNPRLPINPRQLAPIAGTIGLYYAVHLTAVFYVMLVLRQLFARELFSPAWLSVGVLSWLGAGAGGTRAARRGGNPNTFARQTIPWGPSPSPTGQKISSAIGRPPSPAPRLRSKAANPDPP